MKELVASVFTQRFGQEPQLVVFSPGRINLIGEHVDYNDGSVMPAAIDKGICLAISKRDDDLLYFYSVDFSDSYEGSLNNIVHQNKQWANYLLGVFQQCLNINQTLSGISVAFSGNIPPGAGLSSSAALCCATAFAVNQLFNLGLDRIEMVKLAKRTENEFIGLQCGIMDQFASMMSRENHLIQLDCNTLNYHYFPLQLNGCKIVLFDTCVHHSLASSEYNVRRAECSKGLMLIKEKYPQVANFQHVTVAMVDECLANEPIVQKRCRYVVDEITRVNEATIDLNNNNIEAFGKKMNDCHRGLSELYAVSCTELDFIAAICHSQEQVVGARMMGGGFGGCVIAIIKDEAIASISELVVTQYEAKFNIKPKVYIAQTGDGTRLL